MEEQILKPSILNCMDHPKKPGKYLLFILRHKAIEFGLEITKGGFVKLSDLIKLSQKTTFSFDEKIIRNIVSCDRKTRYELSDDPPLMIRAVQGHSIRSVLDEHLLERIDNIFNYPLIIHGTYLKPWNSIKQTGLNRMTRNNIHFSIGFPQDDYVLSGMSFSSEVFIELNGVMAYYNGIPFFESRNNVILSSGVDETIPSCFIKRATDFKGNLLLSQQYDICIGYDIKQSQMQIYSRLQRESIDNSLKVSLDNAENFNAFSQFFIQTKLTKLAFIVVIEKQYEKEYKAKIKSFIERGEIDHPSLFIDYIVVDSICESTKTFDSSLTRKVEVDYFKHFYNVDINRLKAQRKIDNILHIEMNRSKEQIESITCELTDLQSYQQLSFIEYSFEYVNNELVNMSGFINELKNKATLDPKTILYMKEKEHFTLCSLMVQNHLPIPDIFCNKYILKE